MPPVCYAVERAKRIPQALALDDVIAAQPTRNRAKDRFMRNHGFIGRDKRVAQTRDFDMFC
jgi:hypothetical protein